MSDHPPADQRVTVRSLFERRRLLNREIEKTVRQQYPIGCVVAWKHGAHFRGGEVIDHGYGTSLRVRSNFSGKETFVDAEKLE